MCVSLSTFISLLWFYSVFPDLHVIVWALGHMWLMCMVFFPLNNHRYQYSTAYICKGYKNTIKSKEIPFKKKKKNLQNKSKNKNNKCFSWVSAVSILSLAGSHSPPHLPRMPSNTVLISGSAVGAAQILIWSYSCVFLPPMSTAIRTSVFSFGGALNGLLYIL